MKTLLKMAGFLLALLAVIVLLFGGLIVKMTVTHAGSRMLGVPLKLQDVELSLWRGQLILRGLRVGNPEGFRTEGLLDLRTMTVDLDVVSLLKDTVVIKEIRMEAPEITYERGSNDNNMHALLARLNPPGSASVPEEATPGAGEKTGGQKVIIRKLIITGAHVNAATTVPGGRPLTLSLPPISLENIGGGANDRGQGVTFIAAIRRVLDALLWNITKALA